MTDLVEFLRTRLDEDERVARRAEDGPWTVIQRDQFSGWEIESSRSPVVSGGVGGDGGCDEKADADHIARHNPVRVLREVEAKRLFLSSHKGVHRCDWGEQLGAEYLGWCTTLKRLALSYADHPDYDEEWRP